ncbi:MAG: helix-turn-helix domain-containing protein [Marinilabiliaceae bacterium]|jgi:AraC-like DNA-binding protein/tetratricopeptide (TPR) repeat protein|nr:helix-turn-helix domain-containing protein [Marinilabiliaceae bacterium]
MMNRVEENNINNSMEDVFLSRINDFVLENLTCEDFTIQRLSIEIGYSRSQIHRKLKKITGKSLTQYIREIRLEEAYKLLESRVGNVSEIAFMVGFGSPVYFNKCFREYYGVSPGEVMKKNGPQPLKRSIPKTKTGRTWLIIFLCIIPAILITYILLTRPVPTIPASITSTSGDKENHEVFRDDQIHRILIFLFDNFNAAYPFNSWLSIGIRDGIYYDLSQFNYIVPYGSGDQSLQERIERSKRLNCDYFVTGSFKVEHGLFEICSRIHRANTGTVIDSSFYTGSDLFKIIDSISLQTRVSVGIRKSIISSTADLPFSDLATNSFEAYRLYIIDYYSGTYKKGNFVNIVRALDLDSTFALASWKYAYFCHDFNYAFNHRASKKYIDHAIRHSASLPKIWQEEIRALEYSIKNDPSKMLASLERAYRFNPGNTNLLELLIKACQQSNMFDKANQYALELNKIVPDNPESQFLLADSYFLSAKPGKGLRYTSNIIDQYPEHRGGIHISKSRFHLFRGELEKARQEIDEAMIINHPDAKWWSNLRKHVQYLKEAGYNPAMISKFLGSYRLEDNEAQKTIYLHNGLPVVKQDHRGPVALYPLSDTLMSDKDGFFTLHFNVNDKGKVEGCISRAYKWYGPRIFWKEDSLILKAKEQLDSNERKKALTTFKQAYKENPKHYYLGNYIEHLEFLLGENYNKPDISNDIFSGLYNEDIQFAIDRYLGKEITADDQFHSTIFLEDGNYLWRPQSGMEFELLQMSDKRFMLPSIYCQIIEFVEDEEGVTGIRVIMRNGKKYSFKKLSSTS